MQSRDASIYAAFLCNAERDSLCGLRRKLLASVSQRSGRLKYLVISDAGSSVTEEGFDAERNVNEGIRRASTRPAWAPSSESEV